MAVSGSGLRHRLLQDLLKADACRSKGTSRAYRPIHERHFDVAKQRTRHGRNRSADSYQQNLAASLIASTRKWIDLIGSSRVKIKLGATFGAVTIKIDA